MTQKEINEFLANTKVYVNGKSKEIQEKLFSLGYKLWGGHTDVDYTEEPFLFIYPSLLFSGNNNMAYFSEHKHREITAEQILALEVTEPTYRPFKNQEELWNEMLKHEPFGWVKRIDAGYFANIAVIGSYGIMFRSGNEHFYDIALAEYTFADGSLFGIKED